LDALVADVRADPAGAAQPGSDNVIGGLPDIDAATSEATL